MKKIGLVGGLGPASTIEYYSALIELCRDEYGKDVYPKIVIDSVNMAQHTAAFDKGDFDEAARLLLESLENLKAAGAELPLMIKQGDLSVPVINSTEVHIKDIYQKAK